MHLSRYLRYYRWQFNSLKVFLLCINNDADNSLQAYLIVVHMLLNVFMECFVEIQITCLVEDSHNFSVNTILKYYFVMLFCYQLLHVLICPNVLKKNLFNFCLVLLSFYYLVCYFCFLILMPNLLTGFAACAMIPYLLK